jgi:hypothetical protein
MDIKEQPEASEEQRVSVEAPSNGQPQDADQQQDQQQHRYEMAAYNLTPPNQTVVVDPVCLISLKNLIIRLFTYLFLLLGSSI